MIRNPIQSLYQRVLQRNPTEAEGARDHRFLSELEEASIHREKALGALAHALVSSTELQFLD